jgi:hypothetical protein
MLSTAPRVLVQEAAVDEKRFTCHRSLCSRIYVEPESLASLTTLAHPFYYSLKSQQ